MQHQRSVADIEPLPGASHHEWESIGPEAPVPLTHRRGNQPTVADHEGEKQIEGIDKKENCGKMHGRQAQSSRLCVRSDRLLFIGAQPVLRRVEESSLVGTATTATVAESTRHPGLGFETRLTRGRLIVRLPC